MKQPENEIQPQEPGKDHIRDVVYLLRKIMQGGQRYTKKLNKNFNVSTPQLASLLALNDEGPLSPSQIAKKIMVQSSTVTGIIDRLEQKGLAMRERNSPDRRVVTVRITDPGRALVENAPPPVQMKIVNGLQKLQEEERKEIINSLTKLAEMVDAQDLDVEAVAEPEFF